MPRQIAVKRELQDKRRGERLQTYAYHAIKEAILNGKLRADIPLSEERLAANLEISRTPIREALAILEHERLIETVPYQGLFVKAITVTEFLEMYETYELIEAALARRAAMNATANDIADMELLLGQAEQAIPNDPAGHMAACRQFLRRLGECSQQRHMSAVLLTIDEQADVYMVSNWEALPAEKMLAAVTDRRAILEAIRLRDPEGAARAASAHTQAVCSRWREMFKARQNRQNGDPLSY